MPTNYSYDYKYFLIPHFLRGVRGDQMSLNNSDFHLPYNQKLIIRAKELRKNLTIPEKKLWHEY